MHKLYYRYIQCINKYTYKTAQSCNIHFWDIYHSGKDNYHCGHKQKHFWRWLYRLDTSHESNEIQNSATNIMFLSTYTSLNAIMTQFLHMSKTFSLTALQNVIFIAANLVGNFC